MSSVVHVDPGVELAPEANAPQPKPSSPVSVDDSDNVEPWIAQVKSSDGNIPRSLIELLVVFSCVH